MAKYQFLKVGRFRGKLNDSRSFLHIHVVGEIHDIDEVFADRAEEFGWADPCDVEIVPNSLFDEVESEENSVDVEVTSSDGDHEETISDDDHEETASSGAEESTDQKPETARQRKARQKREAKEAKAAKKAQSALE